MQCINLMKVRSNMKSKKNQTKKFAAYDAADCDIEFFDTKEDAEKWLTQNDYDGVSEESVEGKNWIAEIKWRSVFYETDRKSDYHEHTDDCPENCNEQEWPYDSNFDSVGFIKYEEVEYDKDIKL
jgi:hypothetical protein